MNNELKELIEDIKYGIETGKDKESNIEIAGYCLSWKNCKLILDYITNLQEQLNQASLDIQELTERDIECPSWCDKLTNLQQENNNLKTSLDESQEVVIDLQKENEKLEKHKEYYKNETKRLGKLFYITKEENIKLEEAQKNFEKQFIKEMDYKSRIEKAVEYIKEHTFQEEIGFDNKKGEIHYGYFVECKAKELLNILNGRSDE